jgi:hypothetical protein
MCFRYSSPVYYLLPLCELFPFWLLRKTHYARDHSMCVACLSNLTLLQLITFNVLKTTNQLRDSTLCNCRSRWPHDLRRRSAGIAVRISTETWMSVSSECCVSGKGLCDGPIPRPKNSYRVCLRAYVCVSFSVINSNDNPLHLN